VQSMRPGWLAWAAFVLAHSRLPMRWARLYPHCVSGTQHLQQSKNRDTMVSCFLRLNFFMRERGRDGTSNPRSLVIPWRHHANCWTHFTSRENLLLSSFPRYLFTVRG
jgi:hypothetical protein